MNHYEAFNDPFECWAEVLSKFPHKRDKSERLLNIYKAWGFSSLEDTYANDNYDLLVESLESIQPDINSYLDSARITCFSRRADNLLMWSHYADGLRGFCIEYDPALVLFYDKVFSKFYDVEYSKNPAIIDTALMSLLHDQTNYHSSILDSNPDIPTRLDASQALDQSIAESDEIFRKMLATKPHEWEYEEEIRLISQSFSDKEGGLFKYPPQAIKSVIFGEKMPIKQQTALRYIFDIHQYPIEFKTASRNKGSFKIFITNCI